MFPKHVFRVRATAGGTVAAIALAACGGGSTVPSAPGSQLVTQSVAQQAQSSGMQGRPIFNALPYNGIVSESVSNVPLWHGSFVYSGATYHYTMVGKNPAVSNTATTIPVDIIPLQIEVGTPVATFDALHVLSNKRTVVQNTIDSPIFSSIDFKSGSVDLGVTQYLDAFQRGNFWSSVSKNTGYHVKLGTPTVMAEQTIHPPSKIAGSTATEFGIKVALVDQSYFDAQIKGIISTLKIPPTTLPIFLTYDTYLTLGSAVPFNCCVGGYHSYDGINTYSQATYIDKVGAFSQNVSALSHEIGEWVDDPLVNNNVACGILEVGDPLEGNANYGGYPYTANGFNYTLQDLVFLPYFGAPKTTSVNDYSTFQGEKIGACSNGG